MDDVERSDDKSGAGPLFSRAASDNVEVVDPDAAVRDAGLWTVAANQRRGGAGHSGTYSTVAGDPDPWDDDVGDDDAGIWDLLEDDEPGMPPFPPPPFGQPYRSPVVGAETVRGEQPLGGRWSPGPEREQTIDASAGADLYDDADRTDVDDVIDVDEPYEPYDDLFDEPTVDEPITDEEPFTHAEATSYTDNRDTLGSLFRSEPVERDHDVIDAVDALDDTEPDPVETTSGPSPFSSGSRSDGGDLFGVPREPSVEFGGGPRPSFGGRSGRPAGGAAHEVSDLRGEATTPGFLDAINALDMEDRARARVALVAVGALLGDDEHVVGLVVGQMLGHSAVLVLTADRILVVNDRAWQPVVDQYRLDPELEIRGRHDSSIAAIGLGDGRQLSMIDGIRDVPSAIGLVERIRSMTGAE